MKKKKNIINENSLFKTLNKESKVQLYKSDYQ